MKNKKRFKDERAILAAIHQCHRDANAAIVEAEALEAIAKTYFTMPGMVEDAILKKAEALTLRKRANRLLDVKAVKLGECLSEFRTEALPFLQDLSVKAV